MTPTAELLGCTTRTIRLIVADGRLRAYRLGPSVMRLRSDEVLDALQPPAGRVKARNGRPPDREPVSPYASCRCHPRSSRATVWPAGHTRVFEKVVDALPAHGGIVNENGDKARAHCPAHRDL